MKLVLYSHLNSVNVILRVTHFAFLHISLFQMKFGKGALRLKANK